MCGLGLTRAVGEKTLVQRPRHELCVAGAPRLVQAALRMIQSWRTKVAAAGDDVLHSLDEEVIGGFVGRLCQDVDVGVQRFVGARVEDVVEVAGVVEVCDPRGVAVVVRRNHYNGTGRSCG